MDNYNDLIEKTDKTKREFNEIKRFFDKYKVLWFKKNEVQLGSVSFSFDEKYILDCGENVTEYDRINEFIKSNKLDNVFNRLEIDQINDNTVKTIVFKYSVNEENKTIDHKKPILIIPNKHCINSEIVESINQWLPVCHSITHKFKNKEHKDNKSNVQPIWGYRPKEVEQVNHPLCLIWVYEKITINEINSDGYLTINFIYKNASAIEDDYLKINKKLVENVMPLLQSFAMNKINDIFIKESRRQAIKAAKAGIISRNMSHNLGSHVLSYLHTRLKEDNTVYEIKESLLLEAFPKTNTSPPESQFIITVPNLYRNKIIEFDYNDKSKKPFIFGLSSFVSYLQDRQDFIATISTSYKPSLSTVNFKDFIFDEINLDYKQKRHANLEEQENILLKYIALSEGIGRDKISIKFRGIDGQEKESAYSGNNTKKLKDFIELRKLKFDLPGGIIGTQAIFSIFENILRNEAKHSIRNRNTNQSNEKGASSNNYLLDFEIDITDIFKNPAFSNLSAENLKEIGNTFYEFSIKSNTPIYTTDIDKVKKILNNAIKDPYIDKYGLLQEGNKGIKEMRISAAWLRNEDVSEIEEDKVIPPILSIDIDDQGCLTYYFYVFKPKKVCCISTNITANYENLSKWNKKGWDFYESIEKISNNASNYHFYITDDDKIQQNISDNISLRSLKVEETFFKDLSPEDEESKFIELSKLWNSDICKKSNLTVILDDNLIDRILFNSSGDIKILSPSDINTSEDNIQIILFKTHNDKIEEFKNFKNSTSEMDKFIYNKSIFLEGISGGNSTDRIIRHDIYNKYQFEDNKLNPLWYYHIIESSLTTVLIIDERLHNEKTESISSDRINKILYHKKRIHIINFEYNENDKLFEIKDIGGEILGTINKVEAEDKSSLTLNWKKREIVDSHFFGVYAKNEADINYDFITIHQGLLDKMKTVFEVDKKSISDILNINMRPKRLIVHSGRSKPSKEDLPDNVAFLQWASLSKAFYDCKQTLTDLLFSLKIEKND